MLMKYLSEYQPSAHPLPVELEDGGREAPPIEDAHVPFPCLASIIGAGGVPPARATLEGDSPYGLLDGVPMHTSRPARSEADLYRRSEWITTLARGLSVGLALLALALLWTSPRTRPVPAVLNGCRLDRLRFFAIRDLRRRYPARGRRSRWSTTWWTRSRWGWAPPSRGACRARSGCSSTPTWSRCRCAGGLRYAMAMGSLDAIIVLVPGHSHPRPAGRGPPRPGASSSARFIGGTTSSYLHEIQARLHETNRELQGKNVQLLDDRRPRPATWRARRATTSPGPGRPTSAWSSWTASATSTCATSATSSARPSP